MDDGALLSLSLHGLHVCRVYKLGPLLSQWSPTKAESLFKRYTLWIGTIFSTLSIRLTPFESMAMAPTAGGERRAMPKVPNSSHLKHHPRLQLLVRCRVGQRRGMVGKGGGQRRLDNGEWTHRSFNPLFSFSFFSFCHFSFLPSCSRLAGHMKCAGLHRVHRQVIMLSISPWTIEYVQTSFVT